MAVCRSCGAESRAGARFCDTCGARLDGSDTIASPVRKTVTVLFSDVTGSTSLGERSDPEIVRTLMTRFFSVAREIIEAHGGTVEKYIGDAVMAVFGVPTVHEDDALRAVRAAAQLLDRVNDLATELRGEGGIELAIRTGVNTGPVVVGDGTSGETLATGDAVNVAARLQQNAQPGEVWIGESTYRLTRTAVVVEPLGPLALRGRGEPVVAYRLRSVEPAARLRAQRLDLPIVGRERELSLLGRVLDDVIAERRVHLFTLLGVPGVGKSRLVRAFLDSTAVTDSGCIVLRGQCLPYGEGLTYWAIADAVKQAAGITDADSLDGARERLRELVRRLNGGTVLEERIGELVGLAEGEAPTDELTWAARSLLELLAASAPVILVLDDVQWAGAPLLDLIEHVVDLSRDAPILVLCLARPDLLEIRPGWAGGKLNATTQLLEALPTADAEALAVRLLGDELAEPVRRRIVDAAEGNPLFVEEYARMLADERLVSGADGRTEPELTVGAVPPTIQALLAARLDRLPSPERAVAGRASIVGRVFEAGAVAALSPEAERSGIGDQLGSLVRKELVRPERPGADGQETYRFRHLLIRDAAYEALSKGDRARLHEQFADWLTEVAADRLVEYEEIVGYHLGQAYRYAEDLGVKDDHGRVLAARAAAHLGAAARRAAAREDTGAASDLLRSALVLARVGSPADTTALTLELADALVAAGQWEEVRHLLDELPSEALADPLVAARVRFERLAIVINTDPTMPFESIDAGLAELVETFAHASDERHWIKALRTRGFVLFARGQAATATDLLANAIEVGRQSGSSLWLEPATWLSIFDAFGPRTVRESIDRGEAMLSMVAGHPGVTAMTLLGLGASRVADDDVERGIREFTDGAAQLAELGNGLWQGGGLQLMGYSRLTVGDLLGAERDLRAADALLEAMNETGFRSTVDVLLAKVLVELGRHDDARVLNRLGRSLAAQDDFLTQSLWRSVESRLASATGQHDEALALGREAVAIARTSDYLALTADALLDLAEVERAGGDGSSAVGSATAARDLYLRKGSRPGLRRAERVLAVLAAPT